MANSNISLALSLSYTLPHNIVSERQRKTAADPINKGNLSPLKKARFSHDNEKQRQPQSHVGIHILLVADGAEHILILSYRSAELIASWPTIPL